MVFSTIYRSLVTRLVAAFIIALVMSPYSEPFATIDGTDFGGAGAVDVVSAKSKISEKDVLVVLPIVAVVMLDVAVVAIRPLPSSLTLDSRRSQHAILRL
jgi:hypothetical protein